MKNNKKKDEKMEKVIRDSRGYAIGWTETTDKKGTFNEFCDDANYSCQGYISETMKSLDRDERLYVKEKGQLY